LILKLRLGGRASVNFYIHTSTYFDLRLRVVNIKINKLYYCQLPSSGNNENDFAAVDFEPDELLLTSWLHLDRRQILVGSWSHVACLTAGIGDHPFGHDSEDAADCFDDGQVKRQEPVISYAIRGCIRDYDYVRSDDAGNGLARQTLNAINTLNSKKQFDNRMEIVEAVLDQNEIAPQPTGGAGIAKNRGAKPHYVSH
jgi:hypothetical protein